MYPPGGFRGLQVSALRLPHLSVPVLGLRVPLWPLQIPGYHSGPPWMHTDAV